jgi:hypothetical protein
MINEHARIQTGGMDPPPLRFSEVVLLGGPDPPSHGLGL